MQHKQTTLHQVMNKHKPLQHLHPSQYRLKTLLTQNTSVPDVIDDSSPEVDNFEETQQLSRHNSSRKRKNHSTSDKHKQEKSGLVKINKRSQKL